MHSKFEKFNELLRELKIETAKNLSSRELVHLAQTSKYHVALFKPVLDVLKLVHHVTRGEHDVVKAMLKQGISLICKRGFVRDCSGREFKNISGFEYALWALDKHMWAAMIECIPSTEEGKKVFAQLIAQYNKVNTIGVTYSLNGSTITEKHFDFANTIVKELHIQIDTIMDSINAPGVNDWDAINEQWREGVGGAQKLLPMHVVSEYCSDEPFYPLPEFISKPLSSKQFYNGTTRTYEHWFMRGSKLSVAGAIYKGREMRCVWEGGGAQTGISVFAAARNACASSDMDAMTKLSKVRTKDFIDLKSQLEDQVRLDRYYRAPRT